MFPQGIHPIIQTLHTALTGSDVSRAYFLQWCFSNGPHQPLSWPCHVALTLDKPSYLPLSLCSPGIHTASIHSSEQVEMQSYLVFRLINFRFSPEVVMINLKTNKLEHSFADIMYISKETPPHSAPLLSPQPLSFRLPLLSHTIRNLEGFLETALS